LRVHVAEFIGTFALVFVGCGAIAVGKVDAVGVALAFGITIGVMWYAVGHISGGQFNPAVSIGLAVAGRLPWMRVPTYIVAQVAGAVVAALLLRLSLGGDVSLGVTHPSGSDIQSLVFEGVLAFFLVFVVASVATDPRAFRQAGGAAIGGAITLGALVGGPVSGASMNPARSFRSRARRGRLGRPVDLHRWAVGWRGSRRPGLHVPSRGRAASRVSSRPARTTRPVRSAAIGRIALAQRLHPGPRARRTSAWKGASPPTPGPA